MPPAMAVTLVAIAIPFVWFGIAMTLLRLRDLGTGPILTAGEASMKPPAPLYEVRSSIEVDAPPEVVWKNVIEFPEITEEPELIFRAGVAYSLRACGVHRRAAGDRTARD